MSEIKVNNIQGLEGTHGPVVSGITTMASSGAMSLPRGDTAYRGGRGRGMFAGGSGTPTFLTQISYIEISSTGNGFDWGDLSQVSYEGGGLGNRTRGLFAGWDMPIQIVLILNIKSLHQVVILLILEN